MAAATILTAANSQTHIAGAEVVVLTASDNETYDSKRFSKIIGVLATSNTNDDAHLQADFSGKRVTIRYNGVSDDTVTLMIFGRN